MAAANLATSTFRRPLGLEGAQVGDLARTLEETRSMPKEHRPTQARLVVGLLVTGLVALLVAWSTAILSGVSVSDPDGRVITSHVPVASVGDEDPKSRAIETRNIFNSAAKGGTPAGLELPTGIGVDVPDADLGQAALEVELPDALLVVRDREDRPRGCPAKSAGSGPAVFEKSKASDTGPSRPLMVYDRLRCAREVTLSIERIGCPPEIPTYRIK